MGVCFVAYSVSPSNLEKIKADPPLVWHVLEPEDDSAYLRQLEADSKQSLLQRWFGKPKPLAEPQSLVFEDGELKVLDTDKAWDGLRLCIKLCAPQAPDFFEGDGQLGDFEVGYSPAQYVEPGTITRFAAALDGIQEAELLHQLQVADFKGVYLEGVWNARDEEAQSYLLENFRELRAFIKHCNAHGHAAVLQFT